MQSTQVLSGGNIRWLLEIQKGSGINNKLLSNWKGGQIERFLQSINRLRSEIVAEANF